jgi:carbonic anhydrase
MSKTINPLYQGFRRAFTQKMKNGLTDSQVIEPGKLSESKSLIDKNTNCKFSGRAEEWERIFLNNKKWAGEKLMNDPEYFSRLCKIQKPEFLWIGCADSRVPANEIVGLQPGEIFVHRNIANLVIATDINAQSVIEYAVRSLKVKHIIVCGHYGCAGVNFALETRDAGFLNPWITHIRDVFGKYKETLDKIESHDEKLKRLIEYNTIESCMTLMKNFTIQESYHNIGYPVIHACVYDLSNGILQDLEIDFIERMKQFKSVYWLVSESSTNSDSQ